MKKCLVWHQNFEAIEEALRVNEEFYHSKCVYLVPTEWAAFRHDGEFIGVITDDDKDMVFNLMGEGDYIE